MADEKPTSLRTAYQEVCKSYQAIADFRAKLLGLLPLASGAGIFLLLNNVVVDPAKLNSAANYLLPIGIFGFVVTLGLFFYELRGIQRCNGLITVGKKIEHALEVEGQFTLRPPEIAGFIGSTLAARVIYPAVLAAGAFIALVFAQPVAASILAILVFVVGLVGSFRLNLKVE